MSRSILKTMGLPIVSFLVTILSLQADGFFLFKRDPGFQYVPTTGKRKNDFTVPATRPPGLPGPTDAKVPSVFGSRSVSDFIFLEQPSSLLNPVSWALLEIRWC